MIANKRLTEEQQAEAAAQRQEEASAEEQLAELEAWAAGQEARDGRA